MSAPALSHAPASVDASAPRPTRGGRLAFGLASLLVLGAHLLAVFYFDPVEVLFGAQPVSGSDYDTHIEQTWRVIEGIEGWGQTWVYDVRLLAGHPNGVIFDADNKGWEYLTYALHALGVPKPIAFNAFLLLAHLLVVPLVYVSARLFELERWPSLLASALASGLWLFDSYMHWIWWVGTLAFAFASYFFLLPLAHFHRYARDRTLRHAVACALSMAIAHLIHPYSFFLLVVPISVLYAQAFRTFTRREHAAVFCIAAFVIAVNGEWLYQSLRQWHYILDSGFFGQASVWQVPADFFGVLLDTSTSGIIATRTSIRFLCLAAGAVALASYRRNGDLRFAPLLWGSVFLLVFTYVGGFSKAGAQVQPYRFVGAAAFLAALPAADLAWLFHRERVFAALPRLGRGVLAVLALLGLQHIGSQVVAYFSELMPPVPSLLDDLPAPVAATGYPPIPDYRHRPDHPSLWELATWIDAHDNGRGRYLVQTSAVGEQLAWKTDAEILGGFVLRNLEHAHANLFRRRLEREVSPEEVRAYLEAYAVEWVVLTFPDPWFDTMPDLFELHARVGPHVILRTKVPVSRFEQGDGELEAETNRISVRRTNPSRDLVLRYHFHEMLECRPNCRIEPFPNPVSGVPFIRVPAPHPSSFEIINSYRVQPQKRHAQK